MITLNGQLVKLPCKVISLGLDMQCHHVVTPSTILSVNAAEDKVIIESEGITLIFQKRIVINWKHNAEKNTLNGKKQ